SAVDPDHDPPGRPLRPGAGQQAPPGLPEPVLALSGHRLDLRFHLRLPHGSHLMSAHHDAAHADHGTLKSYIVGFILSIVLTVGSFYMVMSGGFSRPTAMIGLLVLCVAQLLVQLILFMHMGASK